MITADGGAKGFDGGLWTSDLGARYLDRQREAIDRNVLIRRIFVFENEDLARDEAFFKITHMHRDIGVDVRILLHELIPPWLHWALSDFIVFDSAVCYEMTFHFHAWAIRPAIVRTSLSTAPDRIRDLDKLFDQLWQAADPDRQAS